MLTLQHYTGIIFVMKEGLTLLYLQCKGNSLLSKLGN